MDEKLKQDIESATRRLLNEPESEVFLELAELYYKAGLKEEALSLTFSGLEKHPGYMPARILASRILVEKGRASEAKQELEKVTSVEPLNPAANTILENILRAEGNTLEADKLREQLSRSEVKEEKKGNMETSTVAEIYVTQGLVDDAISIYERIALENPLDEKVNNRLKELRKKKDEQYQDFLKKRQKITKTIQALQENLKEIQEALQNLEKEL